MKRRLFFLAAILIILILMGTCNVFKDTPESRVKSFISDLSNKKSALVLRTHFAPSTVVFLTWVEANWNVFSASSYKINSLSSNGNTVTATITGVGEGDYNNVKFFLVEIGGSFFIQSVTGFKVEMN